VVKFLILSILLQTFLRFARSSSLPHFFLLKVILNDCPSLTGRCCQYQRSESELRLMYSMCIVRAVNGLVEPSQQSYFAESIQSLATKIGLPSWFVDLRHDSTHNTLPSINLLRSASRSLLLWSRETYWDQQHIYLENLSYRCLNYDPKNDSPEIIENSNQLDVLFARESTFLANILLPLFHDDLLSALHAQVDLPTVLMNSSERKIDLLTSYKRVMWENLLFKALSSHKGAVHMIVTSIIATAVNDIYQRRGQEGNNSIGSQSDVRLFYYSILSSWVEALSMKSSQLMSGQKAQIPTAVASLQCIVRERYTNLTEKEKVWLEPMKLALDRFYGMNFSERLSLDLIEQEEDQELQAQDDDSEGQSEETSGMKMSRETKSKRMKQRQIKRSLESIEVEGDRRSIRQQRRRMWPLGQSVGDLSPSYLYLLEEVGA
jgi:hypothetical protein